MPTPQEIQQTGEEFIKACREAIEAINKLTRFAQVEDNLKRIRDLMKNGQGSDKTKP